MEFLARHQRYGFFAGTVLLAVIAAIASAITLWALPLFLAFAALSLVGVWDLTQPKHSILRNYPVLGHMRFIFEGIRPEIRQYLLEGDEDELPFSREQRSIAYQRAKDVEDKRPFGTREDVYADGYAWITHSMNPVHITDTDFRVAIGGPDCRKPYAASVYNISAMSFGSLSANAILALNTGAKAGSFAHDTGEGGISRYHRQGGGDLIYEIGSGYFGCRGEDGLFSPERFAEQAAEDQVKLIEVKLSQGAKPGHGGMLPAAKITPEIAEARGIPMGVDCISPAAHSAFSTPIGLVEFLGRLRELSGGKPVGFKLCIGHRREFMCIVKAMLETGITPDFIVVDGKEGGTGAAPLEFANHMGMPLNDGLNFVHNTLRGAGLRGRIRLGASGKLISAFDIARAFALGADWCNSARGFMFAIGCIQAQACHTNKCPVGVATQDQVRARAIDVPDKGARVANFHRNTLRALGELVGSAGLDHPARLTPRHFNVRSRKGDTVEGHLVFPWLPEGFLIEGRDLGHGLLDRWGRARPDSFETPADMPLS
ncbi:FMN-binding glutamate synthase family protein [Paralimibaculum aggregatum]|uniref:FMN-binding glutamate synthase family protein n=1 Tax=Paralimibaculum aggregatum TaxID=3036245 RepID=A0ABQ6LKV4_9RHOB|nr:FMN-binding glutamate synthase family protein [Limibaculum sp. NKW23]GMG81868.1 FMN-binding glutamate synthase family protein [Limibaculum sp. NKW23]